MTDVNNTKRAGWALAALDAFQGATRSDNEDAVADLLADLMHLCERFPGAGYGDFDRALERARLYFADEKADEAEGVES